MGDSGTNKGSASVPNGIRFFAHCLTVTRETDPIRSPYRNSDRSVTPVPFFYGVNFS